MYIHVFVVVCSRTHILPYVKALSPSGGGGGGPPSAANTDARVAVARQLAIICLLEDPLITEADGLECNTRSRGERGTEERHGQGLARARVERERAWREFHAFVRERGREVGGGMLSSCDSKQLDFCKDRSILSVEVEAKMLQTVAMQLVRVSAVLFACFL